MLDKEQQPTQDRKEELSRPKQLLADIQLAERVIPSLLLFGMLISLMYLGIFAPPSGLDTPAVVKVTSDQTLDDISAGLKKGGFVRSALVFKFTTRALGGDRRVHAGTYFFPTPQNVFTIALRFIEGDYELRAVRITVGEGDTSYEIADVLAQKLAPFDKEGFLRIATPREGYLYPDTYFFYPAQDPAEIERSMERSFTKHVSDATTTVLLSTSKHSLEDTVIMASILVGEAATPKDRRMVAGVLWKRIEIGMPLQVDAPFGYILDKSLTKLTRNDLMTDSPYNTYRNKGLPPTAIGSPTQGAIRAAAEPTASKYLYYLSDRNGTMHYSRTYAEHLQNIERYLR